MEPRLALTLCLICVGLGGLLACLGGLFLRRWVVAHEARITELERRVRIMGGDML